MFWGVTSFSLVEVFLTFFEAYIASIFRAEAEQAISKYSEEFRLPGYGTM
jgi:hypothetical protein